MNKWLAQVWAPPHTRGAAQGFREGLNALPIHLVASGNEYRLRCLAQAGVGLGAGSRPPCSPAHYGAGGGFMLGFTFSFHRHPHLSQGEIAALLQRLASLWACHLSLQAEAFAREEMRRAKQPAPRTKLPLKTGDAPKTGVAGESRSSSGP